MIVNVAGPCRPAVHLADFARERHDGLALGKFPLRNPLYEYTNN